MRCRAYIGPAERVVTIEDAAELRLRQPHVVRLESRPPSVEGRGEVTIRDLLRNALRMRPDRIVIGEVRGAEALDLLTALNTGHDGALSTVHANSPEDALRRLETLALMAGIGLPHEAIREQVRRGIELVVHLARGRRGARGGGEVGEVVSAAGGVGVRELWTPVSGADSLATPVLLAAAAAGGMAAVAAARGRRRQPRPWARWIAATRWSPAPRAGREGYAPTDAERRRLAVLGTGALLLAGLLVVGPAPAPLLALAGPGAAAWALARRRARYRRAVERGMPQIATAVADALAGGRSVRAALTSAAARSRARRRPSWPACGRTSSSARRRRRRLARAPGAAARRRGSTRSPPRSSPSSSAAATSPGSCGGSRPSAAERDRVAADARSATAQARFTGLLVVAMPTGAALFAELIQPGFVGGAALQRRVARPAGRRCRVPAGGFAAIRRLSRIEDG